MEFIEILHKHNCIPTDDGISKMKKVQLAFREIDQDRNGVITSSELDDIIRMHYSEDLTGKTIVPLLKPFSQPQNALLVNYRQFNVWLKEEM